MDSPSNTLHQATSAYLRSAMHQPIHWHEWGPEVFARAAREDKPILLDIGAVWCHWCHVMDRESYESPEVAALINEHFIAMKVDRDERPDVDSRYQAAVSAISGQGGWPLTAFLTSDGRPFFGGTYFPPDDRYGRAGFKSVLSGVVRAFRERQKDIEESAASVVRAMTQAETFAGRAGRISPQIVEQIMASAVQTFDPVNGGFGSAPKFPHASAVDLILDFYARSGDPQLENVLSKTLTSMAQGGVYDHIGGGFHRYSVDEHWGVPHFEKMAYDNSELLKNYVRAFQVTRNPYFAEVARDIIRWMDAWLSDREHAGFYASQDADISLDDDGDYFTWTQAEARAVLSAEEAEIALAHYGIEERGPMHHNPYKNVLHIAEPAAQIASRTQRPVAEVEAILRRAKDKLYAERGRRPLPFIDQTVYAGWNAMCISAYLEAGRVLGLDEARTFGLRSLDRILSQAWDKAVGLAHVAAAARAETTRRVRGVLDDYALLAIACLDAYESTAALAYFKFAQEIVDAMVARFFDDTAGGFFDVEQNTVELIGVLNTPRKALQDSPTPAGNPAAAIALMRLFFLTHDESYRQKAETTLNAFAGVAGQYGMFAGTYGIALVLYLNPPVQVIVSGDGEAGDALYRAAVAPFALNKSVVRLRAGEGVAQNLPPTLAETIPLLPAVAGKEAVAVVCAGFACRPPVHSPQELAKTLEAVLHA